MWGRNPRKGRDQILPSGNLEQERRDRVHYATGGPGGIPRWARILKAREEREGARVNESGK